MVNFNDYANFSELSLTYSLRRSTYKEGSGGSTNSNNDRKTIMFKFQNSAASIQLAMAVAVLIGVTLSSGCSSLPNSLSSVPPVASGSQAQYLVDMQAGYGGGKKYRGVIGEGTTVQTAIEESGAVKKFRKMDILVLRKLEGAFQPLKMTSDYDAGNKRVRPDSDYALQHGDRIVITPQSESHFLQLLGTFSDGN